MISKRQIALIHVAKAQLRLCDDDYHAILRRDGGVASSRDLSASGFDAVLTTFKRLGFATGPSAPATPRPSFGARPGMATDSQVALLRTLWDEYKAAPQDDASLGRWLDRTFKTSAVRFLTYVDAQRAIGTLKRMKARKAKHGDSQAHG